ncbi:MAG: sulfatase-like hydrolase/transferase [Planctomycetota bacterium]
MPPPNIVLIMADDLGYGDLSCFGSEQIATPSIDALADRGVTLRDYHSSGPVCTPTRAALMTGRYQQRSGLEGVILVKGPTRQTGLDAEQNHCLVRSLGQAGYATGIFGKWHLGYRTEFNPVHHGFDRFRGYVSGNVDYHSHVDNSGVPDWWDNLDKIEEQGYVTDLVSRGAVDFIKQNRDRPFFCFVSHEAPHWPYQGRHDPPERFPGGKPGKDFESWGARPDRQTAYKEMVEAMDEGVGWIVQELRRLDLEGNTLVLFCSDNGATSEVGSNGPLRGAKGDVFEGGHRVPAVAAWPGRIAPRSVSDETVLAMDLLPTFLTLTRQRVSTPQPLDGIDVSPALLDQRALRQRDVFWRYHDKAAARRGPWKLVRDGDGSRLFNLDDDLAEQNDRADDEPDTTRALQAAREAWEQDVTRGVTMRA